jgi:hypothetical protein
MKTLTKDQIRQLTPEQQEVIGALEARGIKKSRSFWRMHAVMAVCRLSG